MSKRITVDGVDITEQVAAMYDAIAGSMDWGSDFLDVEVIDAILLVGEVAGFEMAAPNHDWLYECGFKEPEPSEPPHPTTGRNKWGGGDGPEWDDWRSRRERWWNESYQPWLGRRLEHWRAQQRAKIAAHLADLKGET